MPKLSAEQQQNVATILRVGHRMGASKKALKAALEAGIVESHLQNLNYGDRDSVGVFQQRPSQGWKGLTNVERAATEFFQRAIPNTKKYGTAGQVAQSVQRSAFPGRYDQVSGQAAALLRGGHNTSVMNRNPSRANPSSDNTQLALSLLGVSNAYGVDPLDLAIQAALQKGSTGSHQRVTTASAYPTQGKTAPSIVEVGKLAQKMGLHVGENPAFGGVHPVHVKNSYHYKGEAIDVSGSPSLEAKFANYLAKHYGPRLAELFWQGQRGVDIKNGKRVPQGFVSGHQDHVHVAIKK